MRDYNIWYWTEGPGKGQLSLGGGGGSSLVPPPPPAPAPVVTAPPQVIEPAKPPPEAQSWVTWGKVIPISLGLRRMSPQIIWLKAPVLIGVTTTADFAVSWGYNGDVNKAGTRCTALYANGTKIWTLNDGKILPGGWSWKFYPGTETQLQDPTMVADKGAANVPAYRNQMYGVFKNFPLEKFAFKLPGISAEIAWDEGEAPRVDSWNPDDRDPYVELVTPLTIRKSSDSGSTYSTNSSVRSQTYHRRGEYYLEFTLDDYAPRNTFLFLDIFEDWTGTGVGFSLATALLYATAGRTKAGIGAAIPMCGPINRNRLANYLNLPTDPVTNAWTDMDEWAEGDTVGLHINMNAGWVKGRVVSQGGGWSDPCWYIQPPANIPSDIALGDPIYVHGTVTVPNYSGRGRDRITVNFGASPFLGAIPSGATAWNGDGNTGITAGDMPLQVFIEQIAKYVNLDPAADLEFVGITDKIHGGLITEDTVFRDFLAVLGRAYGFDFVESDKIRIIKRVVAASYVIDKVIPREDMLTESDRSLTTVRRKDDSPSEIELKYIDVSQQFRWNLQKARRVLFPVRTTSSDRRDSFSIPVITTANLALTSAGRALYREAMQNVDHKGSLLTRHLDLEPADIVTITVQDTQYTVKIAEMEFQEDMRIAIRAVNLLTDEDMTFTAEAGEPALPYVPMSMYMVATEGADHFAATNVEGVMFAEDRPDGFSAVIQVLTLAATEGADRFAGSQFSAVLAATDRPDTFAGSGIAAATMAATDRPDTFAGVGGAVATDPYIGYVVYLSGYEGADASTTTIDEATNKTVTTVGNAQIDTAQFKFGTSSVLFDGSGDRLTLADHDHWDLGTNPFTIEGWFRFNSKTTEQAMLGQWDNAGTATNCAWYLFVTGGKLTFRIGSGGSAPNVISYTWTPVLGQWYHICIDRSIVSGSATVRAYIDGVMADKITGAPVAPNLSTAKLILGAVGDTGAFATLDFNGWMDEIRITNGIARYASDAGYTVPTAAFPRPADPTLTLDLDFTTMG